MPPKTALLPHILQPLWPPLHLALVLPNLNVLLNHRKENNEGKKARPEKGSCVFHQLTFWCRDPFLFRIWLTQEATDVILVQYSRAPGQLWPWEFKAMATTSAIESSSTNELINLKIDAYRIERITETSSATLKQEKKKNKIQSNTVL